MSPTRLALVWIAVPLIGVGCWAALVYLMAPGLV